MIDTSLQASVNRTIPISNLLRARFSPGRIALPVRNQAIYARFKYVQGVPASMEGQGFSISRLRMLDNLIDRLTRLQGTGAENGTGTIEPSSAREVEGLIAEYTSRLHRAVESVDSSAYPVGYGSGINENGMLLDLFM